MSFNFYYLVNGNKYLCSQIEARYKVLDSNIIFLCPFTILSGAIWNTNNGFNNLVDNNMLYTPTNNTQKTLILTGNNPINIRWDNSIKPSTISNHSFNKNFQIGDYFTCLLSGSYSYTKNMDGLSINGLSFLNLSTDITITVILPASDEWVINSQDLMNKLFVIKGAQINTEDLFYVTSIQPTLNEQLPKIESYTITLKNLNLEYANTGKEILQMINFCMIGDNYAYPSYNPTKNTIELDKTRLNSKIGVTSIEVLTNSAQLFNSISLYGGIANCSQINPLQKLLLWTATVPTTAPLELTGSGINAYYIWTNAKPVFHEIFNTYTEWVSALNNVFGQRNYIGGLTQDINIENTNVLTKDNNNYYYSYWNPNWSWTGNGQTFNTYSKYAQGGSITFNVDTSYHINDILNLNSVINENIYQFSPSFEESTQFQIANIPIIGELWKGIAMGCEPTFYINNYSLNDLEQSFILITPIHQYLTALSAVSETQGPISLDFFSFNNNENVKGAKVNVCNLQFKITDRFIDKDQAIQGYVPNAQDIIYGNEPQNGIYNTLFIGQTTYPNGEQLPFATPSITGNSLATSPSPQALTSGFYIGGFKQQSIGLTQERLNFYSDLTTAIVPVLIYQNIFNTSSLMRNNPCLWTDGLSFSIYTQDILQDVQITWPNKLVATYLNDLPVQTPFNTNNGSGNIHISYSENLDNAMTVPSNSQGQWIKYDTLPTKQTLTITFNWTSNNWFSSSEHNQQDETVNVTNWIAGLHSDVTSWCNNATIGPTIITIPAYSILNDWTMKTQSNNQCFELDLSFINPESPQQQSQVFVFKIPAYSIGLSSDLWPNNFVTDETVPINPSSIDVANSNTTWNNTYYMCSGWNGNNVLEAWNKYSYNTNLGFDTSWLKKVKFYNSSFANTLYKTIDGTNIRAYANSYLYETYYNTQNYSLITNCFWSTVLSNYGANYSSNWNIDSSDYAINLTQNAPFMMNQNNNLINFVGNNPNNLSNQPQIYPCGQPCTVTALENEPFFYLQVEVQYTKQYPNSIYVNYTLSFDNQLSNSWKSDKINITKIFYTSEILNPNKWLFNVYNGGAFSSTTTANGYTTAQLPFKVCETNLQVNIKIGDN